MRRILRRPRLCIRKREMAVSASRVASFAQAANVCMRGTLAAESTFARYRATAAAAHSLFDLVLVFLPDGLRNGSWLVSQGEVGFGSPVDEESGRAAVKGHRPADDRPVGSGAFDMCPPSPRSHRRLDLIETGIEPPHSQSRVNAERSHIVHIAPDDLRRLTRVKDEARRAGGDQLGGLELSACPGMRRTGRALGNDRPDAEEKDAQPGNKSPRIDLG